MQRPMALPRVSTPERNAQRGQHAGVRGKDAAATASLRWVARPSAVVSHARKSMSGPLHDLEKTFDVILDPLKHRERSWDGRVTNISSDFSSLKRSRGGFSPYQNKSVLGAFSSKVVSSKSGNCSHRVNRAAAIVVHSIRLREKLVAKLFGELQKGNPSSGLVRSLLGQLRAVSISVVEGIQAWKSIAERSDGQGRGQGKNLSFTFQGRNYLFGMNSDLEVLDQFPLTSRILGTRISGNPLLIPSPERQVVYDKLDFDRVGKALYMLVTEKHIVQQANEEHRRQVLQDDSFTSSAVEEGTEELDDDEAYLPHWVMNHQLGNINIANQSTEEESTEIQSQCASSVPRDSRIIHKPSKAVTYERTNLKPDSLPPRQLGIHRPSIQHIPPGVELETGVAKLPMPVLWRMVEAHTGFNRKEVAKLTSLRQPSGIVLTVLQTLRVALEPRRLAEQDLAWEEIRRFLHDSRRFLTKLVTADQSNMRKPGMGKFFEDKRFKPLAVGHADLEAARICEWMHRLRTGQIGPVTEAFISQKLQDEQQTREGRLSPAKVLSRVLDEVDEVKTTLSDQLADFRKEVEKKCVQDAASKLERKQPVAPPRQLNMDFRKLLSFPVKFSCLCREVVCEVWVTSLGDDSFLPFNYFQGLPSSTQRPRGDFYLQFRLLPLENWRWGQLAGDEPPPVDPGAFFTPTELEEKVSKETNDSISLLESGDLQIVTEASNPLLSQAAQAEGSGKRKHKVLQIVDAEGEKKREEHYLREIVASLGYRELVLTFHASEILSRLVGRNFSIVYQATAPHGGDMDESDVGELLASLACIPRNLPQPFEWHRFSQIQLFDEENLKLLANDIVVEPCEPVEGSVTAEDVRALDNTHWGSLVAPISLYKTLRVQLPSLRWQGKVELPGILGDQDTAPISSRYTIRSEVEVGSMSNGHLLFSFVNSVMHIDGEQHSFPVDIRDAEFGVEFCYRLAAGCSQLAEGEISHSVDVISSILNRLHCTPVVAIKARRQSLARRRSSLEGRRSSAVQKEGRSQVSVPREWEASPNQIVHQTTALVSGARMNIKVSVGEKDWDVRASCIDAPLVKIFESSRKNSDIVHSVGTSKSLNQDPKGEEESTETALATVPGSTSLPTTSREASKMTSNPSFRTAIPRAHGLDISSLSKEQVETVNSAVSREFKLKMSVKELRLFLLAVLGTKSEAIADIIKTFDPTTTAHVLSNPVSDHLTLEDQVIDRLISPQYTRFLARLLSQHLSFGDSSGNEVPAIKGFVEGSYFKLQTSLNKKPSLTPVRVKIPAINRKGAKDLLRKREEHSEGTGSKRKKKRKGTKVKRKKEKDDAADVFLAARQMEGVVIGAIEVTEWLTLAEARSLLSKEMEEEHRRRIFDCDTYQEGGAGEDDVEGTRAVDGEVDDEGRVDGLAEPEERPVSRSVSTPQFEIVLVPIPRPPSELLMSFIDDRGVESTWHHHQGNHRSSSSAGGDSARGRGLSPLRHRRSTQGSTGLESHKSMENSSDSEEDSSSSDDSDEEIERFRLDVPLPGHCTVDSSKEFAKASFNVLGYIRPGDLITVGEQNTVVASVERDTIHFKIPYQGYYVGRELRLGRVERVVEGEESAFQNVENRLYPFVLEQTMYDIRPGWLSPLQIPVRPREIFGKVYRDIIGWEPRLNRMNESRFMLFCRCVPKMLVKPLTRKAALKLFRKYVWKEQEAERVSGIEQQYLANELTVEEAEDQILGQKAENIFKEPQRKPSRKPKKKSKKNVLSGTPETRAIGETEFVELLHNMADARFPMMTSASALDEFEASLMAAWSVTKDLVYGEQVIRTAKKASRIYAAAALCQGAVRGARVRRMVRKWKAATERILGAFRMFRIKSAFWAALEAKRQRERDMMAAEEAYMRNFLVEEHAAFLAWQEAENRRTHGFREALKQEELRVYWRRDYEEEKLLEKQNRIAMRAEEVEMQKIIDLEVLKKSLKKRAENRKRRQELKDSQLLARGVKINGESGIVWIRRMGNIGVQVYHYDPLTSYTFSKLVREQQLKTILNHVGLMAHGKDVVNFSKAELYSQDSLEILVKQLYYAHREGRSVIKLAARGDNPPGKVLWKQVMQFGEGLTLQEVRTIGNAQFNHEFYTEGKGERFLVTVSKDGDVFHCRAYSSLYATSLMYRVEGEKLRALFDVDLTLPETLLPLGVIDTPAGHRHLAIWLAHQLTICKGHLCTAPLHQPFHRRGLPSLMFGLFDGERLLREQTAAKIQHFLRFFLARRRVQRLLLRVYEKQWDLERGQWRYYNRLLRTGRYTKPGLLVDYDIQLAADGWKKVTDPQGNVCYYHARTGRYSNISESEAAKRVQRIYRKKRQQEFKITSMQQLVRSLKFQMNSEERYHNNPENFSAIANYALLLHAIKLDYEGAEKMYKKAMGRSGKHPVVLLGYGMLKLALVEYPRPKSFAEAQSLIHQARQMSPDGEKFKLLDECFFHWGVIVNSGKAQAMANYALLHQCLHDRFDRAEALYRSATKMDPSDDRIQQNFTDLILNRSPGGVYAHGGPAVAVKERSVLLKEYVEYELRQDPQPPTPAARTFWRNKYTRECYWKEPDWEEEWHRRRQRGTLLSKNNAEHVYIDSVTSRKFLHNAVTDEYEWLSEYA